MGEAQWEPPSLHGRHDLTSVQTWHPTHQAQSRGAEGVVPEGPSCSRPSQNLGTRTGGGGPVFVTLRLCPTPLSQISACLHGPLQVVFQGQLLLIHLFQPRPGPRWSQQPLTPSLPLQPPLHPDPPRFPVPTARPLTLCQLATLGATCSQGLLPATLPPPVSSPQTE